MNFMKDYGLEYSKFNGFKKHSLKIVFGFFLIGLLINISLVSAVDVTVSPDGVGTDNSTVNDAIDYVNSIGDLDNTITLLKGVYNTSNDRNNNITINGNLKIIGDGSPSEVVVDGKAMGYLFKISEYSNVTFENISFINGNNDYGGAIANFGNLTVINSIFESNNALFGGAIYSNSNTYISLSNFTNNSEAIWISDGNNTIISSTIINNQKGVFVDNSANSTIINYNRIFNNTNSGFDLENFGENTNADLNWWGTNFPSQEQINNRGENFTIDYWYVLQITLNTDNYLKTSTIDFTKDRNNIYLAYSLSTNMITSHNPLLLPMFNVIVICPWNNTWNRNIQTFSIKWGDGTNWGLPINQYNTYYSVQVFTDNEYILVEINYAPPNLISSEIKGITGTETKISTTFLTKTGEPIYNKTIEFWVNGTYIGSNNTDSNGLALYQYIFDKEGNFNIQFIFNEDESYSKLIATTNAIISIPPASENSNDINNNLNELDGKKGTEKSDNRVSNPKDNSNNQLKNSTDYNNYSNNKVNASMKKTNLSILAMLVVVFFGGCFFIVNAKKK